MMNWQHDMAWTTEHPYWVAVKAPEDGVTYRFHPMTFDAGQSAFVVEACGVTATMAEMVAQPVELILEVDDVPALRNPRILFDRGGGLPHGGATAH